MLPALVRWHGTWEYKTTHSYTKCHPSQHYGWRSSGYSIADGMIHI